MIQRRSIMRLPARKLLSIAGPFAGTSGPVIEAALRARIAYLDIAAEIEANKDTFEHYATRAYAAGVVVVPAMAFYCAAWRFTGRRSDGELADRG
jgi:short subunit dehydrogenase-like uncharacterized protein